MPETADENRKGNQRTLIGAGIAAATLGAAFVWGRKARRSEDSEPISDAPPHVLRGSRGMRLKDMNPSSGEQ